MPGNFGQVAYNPNAFLQGATAAQAFNQTLAKNKAASVFNPEDTTASQAALNSAGLYEDANKLADRPNEVRSAQLKVDQQQQTLDQNTQEASDTEDKAEWAKVGEVTSQLVRARDAGQDPVQAFLQMRPMLESTMGLDIGTADQIAQQLQSNPQFLDTLHQRALGVAGSTVYDKDTGDVVIEGKPSAAAKPQIITKQNADGTYSAYQVVQGPQGTYLEPVEVGPGGAAGGAPAAPQGAAPDPAVVKTMISQMFPGAQVTSGPRSAADNARVGGAANSMHLTNEAVDFVVPGMAFTQENANKIAEQLRAQGIPVTEALGGGKDHADHFHIGFRPKGGAPVPAGGNQYKFGGKPETAGGGAEGLLLDDGGLEAAARQFATYGILPALGSGKAAAATKSAIINRAAGIYGDELDAGGAAADYRANTNALSTVSRVAAASEGFERATKAAADLVSAAQSADFWPTPFAPLNEAAQSWMRTTGDPRIGVYDTAVNTLAEEYAKVMTGALGSAAATEGARQTAHERLNTAHTKAQADAIIKQMKVEMDARVRELRGNVDNVRNKVRTQNRPGGPGGPKKWSDEELDAILKGN